MSVIGLYWPSFCGLRTFLKLFDTMILSRVISWLYFLVSSGLLRGKRYTGRLWVLTQPAEATKVFRSREISSVRGTKRVGVCKRVSARPAKLLNQLEELAVIGLSPMAYIFTDGELSFT